VKFANKPLAVLGCLFSIVSSHSAGAQSAEKASVTRATLANGLRVVILPNALAPVVTVEMNMLVGADETPAGFPGMAHAQEHMAFRGCTGMTADQTAAIYAELGGQNNADTQQNVTQYFATVPSADLDIALEAQAASRTPKLNGPRSGVPSNRRWRGIFPIPPISSSLV